ncbi:hypothetical protein BDZ94DRAFT_1298302 [Collybia nuda]|uniref:Uncharacterized protein n=1 Tax=Collybia nuda TaxID=64659 RepID=A0A9P5Y5Y7_9AGAR|nr:hypothetical protein BDZ94DRAFT_1298302 [Collybia nuda]
MVNYFPHLSITHFKETEHHIRYDEALSVLASLPIYFHTLHLGFLEFNIPPNWTPVRRGVTARPWLTDLTLDNINGELIAWFLMYCGILHALTLKNCALDLIGASYIPNSYTLTLQDMHNPTEIHTFVSRWTGVILNVINCSGFNDDVLDVLGTIYRTSEWGLPIFNAPELEELNIRGCDGFTTEALQELSRRRLERSVKRVELGFCVRFHAKVS